jgi:hypothetical protein
LLHADFLGDCAEYVAGHREHRLCVGHDGIPQDRQRDRDDRLRRDADPHEYLYAHRDAFAYPDFYFHADANLHLDLYAHGDADADEHLDLYGDAHSQ